MRKRVVNAQTRQTQPNIYSLSLMSKFIHHESRKQHIGLEKDCFLQTVKWSDR